MKTIRLIATDLDGTIIGSSNDFPLYTAFRQRMNELKEKDGTLWAACTGRSLGSFQEFFSPMRMMGLNPDFVVVRHAYIYTIGRFGYTPRLLWNLRTWRHVWLDKLHVRRALNQWDKTFTRIYRGVKTISKTDERLCLQFDSEETASVGMGLLTEKARPFKHLKVFQYSREVDVMSVPFTKGLATSELARHLGIAPENILTIGNGYNDISMLDGTVARLTGCPSNSEKEVMEVVHNSGGHIAKGRCLHGVMEVLEAYLADTVCSDLPDSWEDAAHRVNPRSPSRPRGKSHRKRKHKYLMAGAIFAGVLYAALTVFANFNLLPFSGIIMIPYRFLLSLVMKLVEQL